MPGFNETKVRNEILAVLGQLRSKIRGYVLAEGTAMVLIVLGSLFWLSLGLDWLCFWVSRMELPVAVRIVFDLLALILVSAGCVLWIVRRYSHVMKPKALALVLERRFPHLDDRLITSVEIEESTTGRESVLTESMLRHTVDDVMQAAEGLDVGDVFDKVPLRRAMIGAIALIVSIAGFSIVMPEAMGYWWAAWKTNTGTAARRFSCMSKLGRIARSRIFAIKRVFPPTEDRENTNIDAATIWCCSSKSRKKCPAANSKETMPSSPNM